MEEKKNKGSKAQKSDKKGDNKDELASKLPELPDELKKKFEDLKNKLDSLKKKILEKFDKYILGIALLPPEKQPFEKGYESGKKEEAKSIDVLILVDDSDSEKMSKIELRNRLIGMIDKMALEIDKDIKPEVMLLTELRESLFDAKYEILQLIGLSAPIYDPKDLVAALKVSEVHKSMVTKKFEKYVVSYVAVGSMFRGDAKSNDIDVAVVIDDTDVKKMSRAELRDKLGAIIRSMGYEAAAITGVKKVFHIQVYILTDFWESIKEASPVIFTFLRDGVPLYDRGIFMPWKLLLEQGRIRPSPEAIDMFMDMGTRLVDRAKGRMLGIVAEDIYYAALNPSQAALMLYGIPPPTPKETVRLLDEIFVKKEKILEKKYVNILERIRNCYKDIEHGDIKDIKGSEIDKMLKDTEDYLKRIDKLFNQIENRSERRASDDFYNSFVKAVGDVLESEKVKVSDDLIKDFKKITDLNIVDKRFIKNVESIADLKRKKLTRYEKNKAIRENTFLIRILFEHVQRKKGIELERAKIKIKYGEKFGEIYLLDKVAYIIEDAGSKESRITKAVIREDGGLGNLEESSLVELEGALAAVKMPPKAFIKEKIFEDLRKIYGNDVAIMVGK
ncbi:MAG: hypothetical protein AABW87_02445 [Nanoarchaeota archaeon]